jgi:pyruvate/2-oxoglutarate dehydrogenase complex dihydrolipoamide acyltransferase (E2) component
MSPLQTRAPMQAQLVQWHVAVGDVVQAGDVLVVLEAMKMEHELRAQADGTVTQRYFDAGDIVNTHDLLLILEQHKHIKRRLEPTLLEKSSNNSTSSDVYARSDLQAVIDRHAFTLDAQRPEAVGKRHALGLRTARENIADLCDNDVSGSSSFLEYGALAVAAQRARRSHDDLITNTPADGMVTGIGSINGALFEPERTKAVVMAYDATVLAGTQGLRNHQKTDRLLGIALQNKLPVVLFAEGGGGRPGDTSCC